MLNILYVAQTYHPKIGGAERYIDRLAQAMAKRRHTVYVLAPPLEDDAEELERDYQVIRTGFYDQHKDGIKYYLRSLPMARKIGKYIKKYDIDVLHFQYINPFTTPIRFLKSRDVKVYATIHGSGVHFMMNDWLGRKLLSHVLKSIDGISPVSDYCGKLAVEWGAHKDRIFVTFNGTDPEIFTPKEEEVEPHNILTTCRLVPRKDVSTLLKGFKRVHKKISDATLTVVGDGPDKQRLKKLARKLKIKEYVNFTGFVSDAELHNLYRSAGVFVLPAKYDLQGLDIEGFGISLLEAMASGRPVVGANVGGIPSAIKKDWGYLYKPLNWMELGDRLIFLLRHPKIAEKKGRNGRKAVETIYNWKSVSKKIQDMYTTVY